ncbi:MAG: DegT/DnrJ/EryC1/StrS family aminotransferase [Bryobacterales bacterium]|nr:DegT/DnrJ/EryC1/StrS family aminotransferase [Bryobacterales bacterium]
MTFLNTIPRFAAPYGSGDYIAAMAALAGRHPVSPAPFEKLLGNRPMFWSASGRHALWMILRALELPAGSGVAVPLYSDTSVHDAVTAAGLRNVFVDIDPRTLTIDPQKLAAVREQISAVVAVHFFGHLAPMHRIAEAAGGLPVVEDTAHAPLSYLDNRMAGTFGVACFYSFASTKYWPAGGGGLAVVNNPALAGRVAALEAQLPPPPRRAEWLNPSKQFAKSLILRRPFYGLIGRPLRTHVERLALLEPRLANRRIFRGQAKVATRHVVSFPAQVEIQRTNSLQLLECLSGMENIVLPVEPDGSRYNYHLFPVLLTDQTERDQVAAALLRRHVDSSRIYFDLLARTAKNGYRGGCPIAEAAAGRMLTLPNHCDLSMRDIEAVAQAFRESLAEVRQSRQPGRPQPESAPVGVMV